MNLPKTLRPLLIPLALLAAGGLRADPLSKKVEVDFYGDVLSRELHGLATRSDGRLVGGPVMRDLKGDAPCPLLWCLEPGTGGKWIVGGGPGGRILEISADLAAGTFSSRDVVRIPDTQVYALKALGDGAVLAGTSPTGGLYLVRGGKIAARTGLPADSIFDIILVDGGRTALVATGNPGRIYRVDLAQFSAAGISADRISDVKTLASRGVALFGEVSDRNLRRIARLADGRIVAGSAPKGSIYVFAAGGGAPYIAQENRDAEVTDLLADAGGGYFATVVYSGGEIHPVQSNLQIVGTTEAAITVGAAPGAGPSPTPTAAPAPLETPNTPIQPERFGGRSSLEWFSPEGFSETLAARSGIAFYRMARLGDLVVISGGEQGEMTGFDLASRLTLTFAGSASSQVNALEPVPGEPGRFLAIRNNAPGLAALDFNSTLARGAETKRIDLGAPARLGAVRFERLRDLDPARLSLSLRTTNALNETDGWSPWVAMADSDGWRADVPVGRYVELRFAIAEGSKPTLELDKPSIYYLSQNHRPQLQDFRMLSPNFAIVVPPDTPAPVITTVGQLIQASDRDSADRRHSGFLASQIVASPGTRVAFWTVSDSDGDNLLYTFSIRHDGDPAWTDIAVDSPDAYVQFDTLHLKEGTWFTRLVAKQASPRPPAERLSVSFETDDMVVDHTPPEIEEASVRREAGKVIVTLKGKDALSLLDSAEFDFNNGVHETVEQPADGILDGREETFILELPADRLSGATAVEATLYDSAGNGATRRIAL